MPDMSGGGYAPGSDFGGSAAAPQAPMASEALVQQTSEVPPVMDNPYTNYDNNTPEAIAQGLGSQEEEQPINVTGWNPHKESTLGQIADFLLMRRGMKPIFKEKNEARNEQEAMEGFTKDPEQAISRMQKVDPDKAWKMQQQYQTMKRLEQASDEQALDRVGAILGSAKEDGSNYDKVLDTATRYAKYRGLDPDKLGLPQTYDADAISSWRMGAFPVKNQEALKEVRRYHDTTAGISQQRVDNQREYQQSRLNQYSGSYAEQRRHNQAVEGEVKRNNIAKETKGGNQSQALRDAEGNTVGFVNPDGKTATLTAPGGARYKFNIIKDGKGRVRLGAMVKSDTDLPAKRNNGRIVIGEEE
jgi:hypothetical protein